MYTAIRHYRMNPSQVQELAQRVEQEFLPMLRQTQSFVSYHVIDAGNGNVVSISVFQDRAGAEESTRRAADWVKTLGSLLPNPPEVLAGEVVVTSGSPARAM